jgi:hypothetical protein
VDLVLLIGLKTSSSLLSRFPAAAATQSGGQEYFISVDHQDGSAAPEQVMTVQPSPDSQPPFVWFPSLYLYVCVCKLNKCACSIYLAAFLFAVETLFNSVFHILWQGKSEINVSYITV